MKKTGIFYSYNSQKTARAAQYIIEAFNQGDNLVPVNAEDVDAESFMAFSNYIIGAPTWWDGELPNYWDEFVPDLEELDLTGKTFALFGAGNQKGYPENFVDAIGIMAKLFEDRGAKVVGYTSSADYEFEHSKALRDQLFCGLALDFENQPLKVKSKIYDWVAQLKNELE